MEKKLVLIIDQHRHFTNGLSKSIDRLGHKTYILENHEKIKECCEKIKPDLMLLNQSMVFSETEIKTLLSELEKVNQDMEIIFISSYSPDGKIFPFIREKVSYLKKPFVLTELESLF